MITEPGIYRMSMEEYQADPCPEPSLSKHVIQDLLYKSPAHAYQNHPRLNPKFVATENGKFDLGSSAHATLLEGVDNVFEVEAEDWRTKAAKEARDLARAEGKYPLLTKHYFQVKEMVNRAIAQIADSDLGIEDLGEEGDAELSFIWKEDETWLKTRPDWISKERMLIVDYKTTEGTANPAELSRHIISMGYDIQAALYMTGVFALKCLSPRFIFVFQECYEPYLCSFIELPPDFLAMPKQKVEYGLFLWRKCMASGKWPGYPKRVCYPDVPPWAVMAWEDRAAEMGEGK